MCDIDSSEILSHTHASTMAVVFPFTCECVYRCVCVCVHLTIIAFNVFALILFPYLYGFDLVFIQLLIIVISTSSSSTLLFLFFSTKNYWISCCKINYINRLHVVIAIRLPMSMCLSLWQLSGYSYAVYLYVCTYSIAIIVLHFFFTRIRLSDENFIATLKTFLHFNIHSHFFFTVLLCI